jgi:hypothetical protein
MSCRVLSDKHISVLVCYAVLRNVSVYHNSEWHYYRTPQDAVDLAGALARFNDKAYNYYYRDNGLTKEGYIPIQFKVINATVFSETQILKALNAYIYQCDSHPDWKNSYALAVIEAIRDSAIRNLDGYDNLDWEIE